MRVLVIGGTGFIGPNVVRILTAQGNEIAVVHRGKSNPSLPPEVRQILADRAHLRDKRPEIESATNVESLLGCTFRAVLEPRDLRNEHKLKLEMRDARNGFSESLEVSFFRAEGAEGRSGEKG